ncbi:DUF5641 domain-containing protein [Trichonephila clavipes]|nr:DUF5641 domain-containing protein [Trichonephila clavipes]
MGGLWEAGIKSVKCHLKRALGRSRLTYEEFETVIIQVEGILNSRPLTPISNDFDNFEIKPLAENNKGNSGSLEKMEYRLSEYSPTERKVDDREEQCNVWYNVNIDQVRVYHPIQSYTVSFDSHVETLYEGPEEQRSNGIDSLPQNSLKRRSLSLEALDGDQVDRSE